MLSRGMTLLKSKVIQKIEIINAYLYYMGYTSPEYRLIKSDLYFCDVFLVQHLLSTHFLKHLNSEVINNSMNGDNMLKIIVMITMEPIDMYQSEVRSL
jgi:hypothetical protein